MSTVNSRLSRPRLPWQTAEKSYRKIIWKHTPSLVHKFMKMNVHGAVTDVTSDIVCFAVCYTCISKTALYYLIPIALSGWETAIECSGTSSCAGNAPWKVDLQTVVDYAAAFLEFGKRLAGAFRDNGNWNEETKEKRPVLLSWKGWENRGWLKVKVADENNLLVRRMMCHTQA